MDITFAKKFFDATKCVLRDATCGHDYLECWTPDARWVRFKPLEFDKEKFQVEIHNDAYLETVVIFTESELFDYVNSDIIPLNALIGATVAIGGKFWKDEHPNFKTKLKRLFRIDYHNMHWNKGDVSDIWYRGNHFLAKCTYSQDSCNDELIGSSAGSDWLILNHIQ